MRNYQDNPDYHQTGATSLGILQGDFTISFWFRPGSTGSTKNLWAILDSSGTRYVRFYQRFAGYRLFMALSNFNFASSVPVSGQLYHILIRRTGTTIRVYFDGAVDPTTPTVTQSIADGSTVHLSDISPSVTGDLGEFAIWNSALNQADFDKLLARFSAATVSPATLRAYWPLDGDTWDHAGGAHVISTVGNPTRSDSLGMVQPARPLIFVPGGAPPATRRVFVIS